MPLSFLKSHKAYVNYAAISIGIIAFLYFADWNYLNVGNVGWLFLGANTDKAQAYLGWQFFRKSEWSFPIGGNESFGLLPGNSISYSDSIPILAFIFKLFDSLLTRDFQYFGIWLLICFCLQALFTALIIGHFSQSVFFRLAGSCFSVSIPFFLQRIPIHLALSGHFLVLAAIYLNLRGGEERKQFCSVDSIKSNLPLGTSLHLRNDYSNISRISCSG